MHPMKESTQSLYCHVGHLCIQDEQNGGIKIIIGKWKNIYYNIRNLGIVFFGEFRDFEDPF